MYQLQIKGFQKSVYYIYRQTYRLKASLTYDLQTSRHSVSGVITYDYFISWVLKENYIPITDPVK